MTLFLTKLLPLLIYPLGASILLLCIGWVILMFGRRRIGSSLVGLVIVALWTVSTPLVADWLQYGLEDQYPPVPVDRQPAADVAIVLGGIRDNRLHHVWNPISAVRSIAFSRQRDCFMLGRFSTCW